MGHLSKPVKLGVLLPCGLLQSHLLLHVGKSGGGGVDGAIIRGEL